MALCSRGTNVHGASEAKPEARKSNKDMRDQNDLVMKLSWTDEARHSEANILKKASELAKLTSLIDGHIPELVASVAVQGWNANTGTIRKFLNKSDLPVNGARALNISILKMLFPITELEPPAMFKAYCDILFCKLLINDAARFTEILFY